MGAIHIKNRIVGGQSMIPKQLLINNIEKLKNNVYPGKGLIIALLIVKIKSYTIKCDEGFRKNPSFLCMKCMDIKIKVFK